MKPEIPPLKLNLNKKRHSAPEPLSPRELICIYYKHNNYDDTYKHNNCYIDMGHLTQSLRNLEDSTDDGYSEVDSFGDLIESDIEDNSIEQYIDNSNEFEKQPCPLVKWKTWTKADIFPCFRNGCDKITCSIMLPQCSICCEYIMKGSLVAFCGKRKNSSNHPFHLKCYVDYLTHYNAVYLSATLDDSYEILCPICR